MANVKYKNPGAAMSKGQGFFLCRLVEPDCRWTPAVEAMIASGITMQQVGDSIELARAGKRIPAMKARIEELASAAGVEVNSQWREEAEKSAPVKEVEVPQTLLDRVAELEAQNSELRVAAYGDGLVPPDGMTFVRGHFRKSK